METATQPFKINVGGEIFTTTKNTISLSGFLSNLVKYSSDEVPFVDRDPEEFRHILRFLRDDLYSIPDKWSYSIDFYSIKVQEKEQGDTLTPEELDQYILNCKKSKTAIDNPNLSKIILTSTLAKVNYVEASALEKINYVEKIIQLKRHHHDVSRSCFRVPMIVDELLYVNYNFNEGPITSGIVESNHFSYSFGKSIPFPHILLYKTVNLTYITMCGNVDTIYVAVRVYLNKDSLDSNDFCDYGHQLEYRSGSLHSMGM